MKTVLQIRVDEDEKARWMAMAKDAGLSLSDFVRRRMKFPAESDSLDGVSFTHGAPTVGIDADPGRIAELDKIIAEKDAEIARLKNSIKRLEDIGVTLRPQSTDKDLQDKVSFGITYREQGLKNQAGGVKGHKLNCRCNMCAELRGKK